MTPTRLLRARVAFERRLQLLVRRHAGTCLPSPRLLLLLRWVKKQSIGALEVRFALINEPN
jgi:hypothetical protein